MEYDGYFIRFILDLMVIYWLIVCVLNNSYIFMLSFCFCMFVNIGVFICDLLSNLLIIVFNVWLLFGKFVFCCGY